MGDNTKQIRVDNWGIFFLQRLQMFFSKTDYCDMTLQFEGNVQLKVHRLVMNACTEYFQFLEQSCTVEDNVVMMPSDLQADVIVPIVNFMYTGMLEFHFSIYDRLYKTAQLMNITILTKLLDAGGTPKAAKKKPSEIPKKIAPKPHKDLPATLPGRKLPVWKRKALPPPPTPQTHAASSLCFAETGWSPPRNSRDPLSLPDNTPKPTRFEWPEDDLPTLNLMDTSFEDISYTSKPLSTQEEENRAGTSFDDIKQLPNASRSGEASKKNADSGMDLGEITDYVKEQKIRSVLSHDDEPGAEGGLKRKGDLKVKNITKKVKFDEQDGKTTTISIATDVKNPNDLDHEKIVTEILKKYPDLVKKNKNIKLKIMAKNSKDGGEQFKREGLTRVPMRMKNTQSTKSDPKLRRPDPTADKPHWTCTRCSTDTRNVDFVLYYLYRKHMTDVHNDQFDPKLCKYCGHRCNKHNLLMYHLHTKHGMKPPVQYSFPKCDHCPYIALSAPMLQKHKTRHTKHEVQCVECRLAFTCAATLTSHMQITGHTGKSAKPNFDCQYCTKRYQSGVNLFSHVRIQHHNEAIRDGIVSIDELHDFEDLDEEEGDDDEEDNSKDEYILPEIISDPEPQQHKKVNILSNVKVQERHEEHPHVALEPSSEAESLNNVATGIATSLGLVDIVVLNDNRQLQIFKPDDQPEFILPELSGGEGFVDQEQNDDGGITSSMLSGGDIGSTDELVMVLTDHDYGDNQEEITNDSNIVVLYSHPVDGQPDQFITSQGNIMVNSETGLIEIRNGGANVTTTTSNQVVCLSDDSNIESIEMIQREIEGHRDLKPEVDHESEDKTRIKLIEEKEQNEDTEIEGEVEPVGTKRSTQNDALIESLEQGEQIEFVAQPDNEEDDTSKDLEEDSEIMEVVEHCDEEMEVEAETEMDETVEETPQNEEKEVEDDTNKSVEETEATKEDVPCEVTEVEEDVSCEITEVEEDVSCEVVEVEEDVPCEDAEVEDEDVPCEDTEVDEVPSEVNESAEVLPSEETEAEAEPIIPADDNPPTPLLDEEPENEEDEPPSPPIEEHHPDKSAPPVEEPLDAPLDAESTDILEPEIKEVPEEPKEMEPSDVVEEDPANDDLSPSDTSTSQFNDDNSQDAPNSPKPDSATKISILDDWDDTDSQQSDNRDTKKADETVNKLMDDWEDDEEEDNRKGQEV